MGKKEQRLEEIRADLGLNKTKMAALMGIDQSYYQHILKGEGKANLRIEHLEALLTKADVNPVWILTGEGDKIMGFSHDFKIEPGEPDEEQVEALYEMVLEAEGQPADIQQTYKLKLACAQCFVDFPDACDLRELSFAARVYFRLLSRLPQVDIITALGFQNDNRLDEGK